ncbi:peptide chain release factor N(5)-glutamine methyltransferase [Aeromicrobium sp.]|nr:peptide chain release factor N(5)-glutamine methyltransferase [Candidatus Saccharibacteria bacterium]
MTIQTWLKATTRLLAAAGDDTARLDALVLLEDQTGMDRAQILAYPESEITAETLNVLNNLIERRKSHEPLAYLRGKSEFYGREFIVSPAVLVPRPESETMIELLLLLAPSIRCADLESAGETKPGDRANSSNLLRIADVGTGSGALGITAQLELPNTTVDLLDIDEAALEIAKMNVIKFTLGNTIYHTDLLHGSAGKYDVLLCNLPYVPDQYAINDAARHEPAIALFAGADGLDLYRKLADQLGGLQRKPLLILTESLPEQHEGLRTIMCGIDYIEDAHDDFIQAFKPHLAQ